MGKILCPICQKGILKWHNPKPEDEELSFDDYCNRDLKCTQCECIVHGFNELNQLTGNGEK